LSEGREGAGVHLVQILLPVRDNAGEAFAPQLFESVARALTAHFGGVTAYNRSPAEGRWQSSGTVHHDEVSDSPENGGCKGRVACGVVPKQ